MKATTVGAILIGMAAGAAQAQGFEGAEISAEVLGFTDDFGEGQTAYRGSVEFDAVMGVGLAADLGFQGFRGLGSDNRNVTLHAMYGLGDATAGGFWSRDTFGDGGITSYGVEGAMAVAGAAVEGYAGRVDGDVEDGSMVGVDATFAVMGLGVTAGLGRVDVNGAEATRLSAGAEYALGLGPTLYGEIGRLTGEDDDATYLSLGARIAIGRNGGTTFGPRGIFDAVPRF